MTLECIEGNTRYLLFPHRAELHVQRDGRMKQVKTLELEHVMVLLITKKWVAL